MPGGPAFLRPLDELTTRLCFVNFDGTKALEHSRKIGLGTQLGENFVMEYCLPVYRGIKVCNNNNIFAVLLLMFIFRL